MEQILSFETSIPSVHYEAEACVVLCFDHRFSRELEKFLKRLFGDNNFDMVRVAGGAKDLAAEGGNREAVANRDFVLGQIKASCRLHNTKRIILTIHLDCGAYGGSKAFGGDEGAERAHHVEELHRASELVAREISDVEIERYLIGLNGIWKV